jgi:tripartite-type tricarboxylate transporter receptor subunit TctC
MNTRRRMMLTCLAAAALPCTGAVFAAGAPGEYPVRPIRMIVPFAPGGASDFVGRIIQPPLAEQLGQQVVIENRSGAAGYIGVEVAARATPDGYTLLLGNVGTMAINPNFYTKLPVKPLKELVGITQVVDVPGSLVVHPTVPAQNVKDMVAYLKANPGKLNYGSAAPSSANSLEMQMFLMATGTKAVQVPYKGGAGPAMVGLLGNEVQMMFVTYSSALPHVKTGRVRMIAVVSPERVPATPDVPTMREQGFDMTVGSWQGIFVPRGTPKSVIDRLFKAAHATMKDQEVVKRLDAGGVTIVTSSSSAEFRKFWEAENERFARIIRDAKIETE